jgi:hypothetical protein
MDEQQPTFDCHLLFLTSVKLKLPIRYIYITKFSLNENLNRLVDNASDASGSAE